MFSGSDPDQDPAREQTPTTVLTATPASATDRKSDPESRPEGGKGPSTTQTSTPTVAEQVGTPVYRPDSNIDEFGQAVSLSGKTAIVVAEEHGAYVFEAGRAGWTNTTVIMPNDRDNFGDYNVSATLDGDRAIVGGPEAGAAYLFERTDDGWTQSRRFKPENTEAGEFGRSIDFDGDRVLVGDANEPTTMVSYVGGAYVFANNDGDWIQEASLTTGSQDLFGTSVAIEGETALVGAPFAEPDENQTGAIYAYEYMDGSWQRQTVLSPADPTEVTSDGWFGQAVALNGDTAVVGAPKTSRGVGRAYVFERMKTGWSQTVCLSPPEISEVAEFGWSVALVDGTVVVGAPQAHETGRAYGYTASNEWTDPVRLAAADLHEDAEFGADVALSDATALVGAPVYQASSGAYLFDL